MVEAVAGVVVLIILALFFLPVFIVTSDPIAPARGWAACRKQLSKVKIITWRMEGGGIFMLMGSSRQDPKALLPSQHDQLVKWMREGISPQEAYRRVAEQF